MSFNWNDEDDFRDNPVEFGENGWKEVETAAPPALQRSARPAQQAAPQPQQVEQEEQYVTEEIEQYIETDEEDDFTVILSDARLRLEQGRLYEMIMNHNLFEGLDADAKAIRNVQKEIRRFAKERMEVMLGMRQPEPPKVEYIGSQFNELEVTLLRQLASKMSKGKTEEPQAEKYAEVIAKKDTLTPIGGASQKPAVPKKLANAPKAPVARPKALQQAPPQKQDDYEPLEKPVNEMTADELIAHNAKVAKRQASRKAAKPNNAMPMPSADQQEMLYTDRVMKAQPAVATILALMNKDK